MGCQKERIIKENIFSFSKGTGKARLCLKKWGSVGMDQFPHEKETSKSVAYSSVEFEDIWQPSGDPSRAFDIMYRKFRGKILIGVIFGASSPQRW